MIGRLRNLRPRLSGNAATTTRVVDLAIDMANDLVAERARVAELEAERDAAVKERDEMAEGVRLALISAAYFRPSDDLVADVRHMAADYVKTVAELMAARDKAAEVDRLTLALNAARLRPSDTSDQDRRNCVDMSDRNAELRAERDRLERRVFELEGRAAEPTVITGEGLSTWTPR